MKHTPGPWEYKFDMAGHDVRAKSKLIAALGVLPEITQNGHLIAAAPDMLEALKGLFEHCAMVHKHWGDGDNTKQADAAIKAGEAAIAKAEGRQ